MADALEDAGPEVETLLCAGEVHGVLDERNEIEARRALRAHPGP